MQELTLAIVSVDFANADGSNRRSEAMMTLLGKPIELVPEPKNQHDTNAIAVISRRGVQIGYVNAERAPYIGGRMSRGADLVAIFQAIDGGSAFIRVRFGGESPTLPPPPKKPPPARPPRPPRRTEPYDPHAFYATRKGRSSEPDRRRHSSSGASRSDHKRIARENGEKIIVNSNVALDAVTRQQATFTSTA